MGHDKVKFIDKEQGLIDLVNSPAHYIHDGIETIDVIKAWTSEEAYEGFLIGNVIKYISRWNDKGGVEDLKKARWYLDKIIKECTS